MHDDEAPTIVELIARSALVQLPYHQHRNPALSAYARHVTEKIVTEDRARS